MRWVRVASVLLILSLTCFHSIAWGAEARSDRRSNQGRDTDISGIFKTGNAKLDTILAPYSVGKVVTAENLAVATIRSTAPAETSDKYLTLDEALKRKLLTIKEISSGGSVPVLKAISHADTPIFLPFGSIVTGGKQDRMLREDVLLQAKETKDIGVYCIEQGRWRHTGPRSYFGSSSQVATQSMKTLGRANGSQVQIWNKVRERNYQFGSPSASSNVQANLRTAEFKKLAKKLEPVREGVAKQKKMCGSLVILDGKVVGTEIYAGAAYFKKVWPQLFNSYVIDAASKK
jgi:ARG and Rhodanese-Phosphatase-superfamily-associated Protein domain